MNAGIRAPAGRLLLGGSRGVPRIVVPKGHWGLFFYPGSGQVLGSSAREKVGRQRRKRLSMGFWVPVMGKRATGEKGRSSKEGAGRIHYNFR